ncbi:MAG: ABC transporter ATP-binding protein [Lentisphaeria bacterium]|nr:ABC transporter ATP-binding protein [Lentisphaeria bacterium]
MAIIAEKISFSYNRKKVLEDFSISLNRNDFTMLLGSNGSGKSTAVKLLGNFLKPDSGKITVDGINADKLLPFERAKKIAVISQTMPPVLNFTVREMVLMGRFCHVGRLKRPTAEDLQIADESMEKMEVFSFANRYVRELSGGERQRVVLAGALAQQPDYLLLDEPTAALDPAHSLRLMEILQKLNEKIGIMMVCHDLNLAWNYAGKVIILQNGKTLFAGAAREILTVQNIRQAFDCNAVIYQNEGIILQK